MIFKSKKVRLSCMIFSSILFSIFSIHADTTYYEYLGISPDATQKDVQMAIIMLRKDASIEDLARGGKYDVEYVRGLRKALMDPEDRRKYDEAHKEAIANYKDRLANKEEYTKLPLVFELRNKTKSPLTIEIINGKFTHDKELPVAKSSKEKDIPALQLKIDQTQQTKIEITYLNEDYKKVVYMTLIPAGKSMFVTFENGKLRPQKGVFGKTQSGIKIPSNNVTQKEIDDKTDITVLKAR